MIRPAYLRATLGLIILCGLLPAESLAAPLSSSRQNELENLLLEDCGACHGLHLTGGLGPSITRPALAGKSRQFLINTIANGRPGTAMPNWDALLNRQDIEWLADRLLNGEPAP